MMGNRDPQKQLQGMKENQQVVFMSDGGETVRRLQEYLHPCSEHVTIGCFQAKNSALARSKWKLNAKQHFITPLFTAVEPEPGHAITESKRNHTFFRNFS